MDENQQRRLARWSTISKPRGFSLVELMIVVVLIALLAGLSAPTISSSMEQNRVSQLNRDVANGFDRARSHAMRTGNVVFAFTDTTDDQILFYEPNDNTGQPANACVRGEIDDSIAAGDSNVVASVSPLTRGVDLEFLEPRPGGTATICMSPSGRALSTGGQPLDAGCNEWNYLIPIQNVDAPGGLATCNPNDEQKLDRELNNFSMVHVGYGGQVRVIR